MNSFRRLVGATSSERIEVVELINLEVVAAKVTTQDDRFDPECIYVAIKTVSAGSEVFETQRKSNCVRLYSSFTSQWFLGDIFEMNKESKVCFQLMAVTHSGDARLLGGATLALSTLGSFSTDVELAMNELRMSTEEDSSVTSTCMLQGVLTLRVIFTGKTRHALCSASVSSAAVTPSTDVMLTQQQAPSELIKHPKKVSSRGHRRVIGTIRCTIWQGKALATSCPCFVTVCLVTQRSQGCRTPTRSNPHNPVFDYIADIPFYSLQGDLLIGVWEEHLSGTAHLLGQVIVPFSTLLHTDFPKEMIGQVEPVQNFFEAMLQQRPSPVVTEKRWFEVFPPAQPTPFNRGGQYRPFKKGLSQTTGYGLARVPGSPPVGFLRLEFVVTMKESVSLAMLRSPWTYAPREPDHDLDDEEYAVSAVMVAGFTMLDIFNYIWDPPILKKFFEVLNWKTSPAFTILVLYLFSYMALMASSWQYPFLVLLLVGLVGVAAAYDRAYDDIHAFDESELKKADKDEKDKTEKSYSEMIKDMKQTAVVMEKSVQLALSTLTRLNNLFAWADPIMTSISIGILLVGATFISGMLLVFSPNQVFWFGGLSFFTPPELQDYIIEVMFERMNRLKDYLLAMSRNRLQKNQQSPSSDTVEIAKIYAQDSNVPAAVNPGLKESAQDEANESADPDEEHDYEHFQAAKLFSYTWLKTQAYKWLKMTPDDIEMSHRFICGLQLIREDQEVARLPSKKIQINTSDKDSMGSLLGRGSSKSGGMGEIVLSWARGNSIAARTTGVLSRSSLASGSESVESWRAPSSVRRQSSMSTDDFDALPPRSIQEALIFSGHPLMMLDCPRGGEFSFNKSQSFRLKVDVLAARGLNVTESSSKAMGSMAAIKSKLYVNLCIQPTASCRVQYRTGGQPRNPNPIFREEFIFEDIAGSAIFLVVEVVRKSAMQARAWESFYGQAIIAFESLLDESWENKLITTTKQLNAMHSPPSPNNDLGAASIAALNGSSSVAPPDASVAPTPEGKRAKSASFSYDSPTVFGQGDPSHQSLRINRARADSARPHYELGRRICAWFPLTDKASGSSIGTNDAAIQLELMLSIN